VDGNDGTASAIAAGYQHTLAIQVPVPEPTTALLHACALATLALLRRRRA
ncbi:MAG: hypothetical protein GY906_34890, partial [bacterium]|nr:hypothetical protein [bacterium]